MITYLTRLPPLVSKRCNDHHLLTNSAGESSMDAAFYSAPDKPINGVMFNQVWLVLHTAPGPEVVGPLCLRHSSNLELLLPDFGTQGIWI